MGTLTNVATYIAGRLKEPSTHAALSAVFVTIASSVQSGDVNNWVTLLSVVFGALGVLVKERGKPNAIK